MSGRVGNLSGRQEEKLKLFREKVSDVLAVGDHDDDHYLLRWLRARSFDVEKSEEMLRNHVAFNKEWNIEYIATEWEAPEVLEKHMIGGLFGEDKDGRPVYYEAFGTLDCKGVMYSCSKTDMVKYKLRICEEIYQRFEEQSKKDTSFMLQKLGMERVIVNKMAAPMPRQLEVDTHGRVIDDLTMILDLDQVGLGHLWMPFLNVYFDILAKFEANYPETLKRCILINAPSMVSVGYNLFKPFLSADTRTKVSFCGANYKSKLLELIDPDQLPMHYGGTVIDNGDPKCSSRIRYGGKVPTSYYLKEQKVSSSSNLKTETVASGAKLHIPLQVTIPSSALSWEFYTEKSDIGFGVFRQETTPDGSAQLVDIVPSARYSAHLVPESGVVECAQIGSYVVVFDNSYSWVKSKKLFYQVDVLPPDSQTVVDSN